jgi:hypothetical protein
VAAPQRGDLRGADIQFASFVTLWIMAFSFHYLDNYPLRALPFPLAAAALPSLIAPTSAARFSLFLLAGTLFFGMDLPAAANHAMLALLVHVALGGAALAVAVRRRSHGDAAPFASQWLKTARTPIGLTLVVLYGMATFHKLNTSFFDPAVSCAGTLAVQGMALVAPSSGALPDAVVMANAIGTVAWESALVLLIASSRWRPWGVVLGILGHVVLGLSVFYDFATFVFAIYVLFMPAGRIAALERAEWWRRAGVAAWAVYLLATLGPRVAEAPISALPLTWVQLQIACWLVAVGAIVGPLMWLSLTNRAHRDWPQWTARPVWLLGVPCLALLNGVTPYLGLKTVANYSMFSNLRTEEGRTNHLVPFVQNMEISNLLRDTVDVYDVTIPDTVSLAWTTRAVGGMHWIRRQARWMDEPPPVRIPWTELRRTVQLWRDAGMDGVLVTYVHEGVRRERVDVLNARELNGPLGFWRRRLLAFRPIQQDDGPVPCRW